MPYVVPPGAPQFIHPPAPDLRPGCRWWCPQNSHPWTYKCSYFPSCRGCLACQSLAVPPAPQAAPPAAMPLPEVRPACRIWCSKNTNAWRHKCTNIPNCRGCEECAAEA
eukprot:5217235-Prymnesium_polylepis.2